MNCSTGADDQVKKKFKKTENLQEHVLCYTNVGALLDIPDSKKKKKLLLEMNKR